MFTPLTTFMHSLTPTNPAAQIANMHTLFNVVTTLILLPLGGYLVKIAMIILPDRKIASIDGGCVLKWDGQLNALILPSPDSDQFSWTAWDGLPTGIALDPQSPSQDSVNIRWGRSALELLEPGEELSLCRHLETGRELLILNSYLRQGPNGLWCEDSTDYRLPVSPGDRLTVVQKIKNGFLCKKDGVTGWYFGRITDIL